MSCDDCSLPEGTLNMCPRFVEFNIKSCKDLLQRYSKHNTHRSNCIQICANETLREINKIPILSITQLPIFTEQKDILVSSIQTMKNTINLSATVQPSKCKKKILTYTQFSKKANNKQDQNSWKISGKYLFAPYIYAFIEFITKHIHNGDDTHDRTQILELIGITFAVKLLRKTVKFERAKEKPLIRDRTLVNSSCLHKALRTLHRSLNVDRFYMIEKEKRKKIKKQINSHQFHINIESFTQFLLQKQEQMVLNVNNCTSMCFGFPQDWISMDVDEMNCNVEQRYLHCDSQIQMDDIDDTKTEYSTSSSNTSISECHCVLGEHRIFQRSNNYFNRQGKGKYKGNGICKGSGALCIDRERIMNRKIKKETHIAEMRRAEAPTINDCPIFMYKESNNPFDFDHFDVDPVPLQRVGSETIMDGCIHKNEMGYTFDANI